MSKNQNAGPSIPQDLWAYNPISMELQLMLGKIDGQRRRGRPHITWMNNVQNYIANDNIMKILEEARNRVIWRGTVMDVARGRLRLDGTR